MIAADANLFGNNALFGMDTTADQNLLIDFRWCYFFRQLHRFVAQFQRIAAPGANISLQQHTVASLECGESGL